MSPAVHGRGEPPTEPPPRARDCAECGKPFADKEHRGVQTHLYRAGPSVDAMASRMLAEEVAATVANQLRVPMQELATAIGQAVGVGQLSPDMRVEKLAKLAAQKRARPVVIEEQWDGPVTGNKRQRTRQPPVVETRCCPSRRRRHRRRIPSNWWKRRCRCHECHRKPNYALIEAMERECKIRNEEGELVWPPPAVGSHDQHGRTVVAVIEDEGDTITVWDRPAPPGPPPRDPGRAQWV